MIEDGPIYHGKSMGRLEFVPAHRKVSRKVGLSDYKRVVEEGRMMGELMYFDPTRHCVGIAHPQVDDKDPLAFFITQEILVINPKIIMRSTSKHKSDEGCMTFPGRPHLKKSRFDRVLVEYETIEFGVHQKYRRWVSGHEADIFQHEVDHLLGKYCYD